MTVFDAMRSRGYTPSEKDTKEIRTTFTKMVCDDMCEIIINFDYDKTACMGLMVVCKLIFGKEELDKVYSAYKILEMDLAFLDKNGVKII